MIIEHRRLAMQKALDRIRNAELPLEQDPRFLRWIEQWIAGELEMADIRQLYAALLRERSSGRVTSASAPIEEADDISADVLGG
ncbi:MULTISPECIES: hypothetical protein [unclassified Sinorhizobium]|uniref:hypothetical protein n=1 Tax=unclassified Sinorhizobium TaxID=2613772 RepID=UPI003523D2E6